MPANQVGAAAAPVALTNVDVMWLSVLATIGLVVMWVAFWFAAYARGEKVSDILASNGFFRTVVVLGVIATTAVLGLAGRLEGNTSAILSGVAGYVLGHLSTRADT